MKLRFYILIIMVILLSQNCLIIKGNTFYSSSEVRKYLSDNVDSLAPIEGEYNVEFSGDWKSPFDYCRLHNANFTIWIISNGDDSYTIYTDEGKFRKSSRLRVNSIGQTNAYTFYYASTPTRIYLENQNHFRASVCLNSESASIFRDTYEEILANDYITLNYDCIKSYPTSTMYSNSSQQSKTSKWSGTGFFLTKNGYIITNHHVIAGARNIKVSSINGNTNTTYNAIVEISDKQNDLAIIKITDCFSAITSIPYTFKFASSSIGENCWVLGYPLTQTMGEDIKITNGIISSKSGFDGNITQYQISAPIQPGNSGGPLFDNSGNLIGVVQAKHETAENAGYAVKASYLIDMLPTPITLPQANQLDGKSLPQQVELASKCVCLIICE